MDRKIAKLAAGLAAAAIIGFAAGYFLGSRPTDQHMSVTEALTLLALFGQLGVFAFQWRLMREQLRLGEGAEERAQRHDRLSVRPFLSLASRTGAAEPGKPGELVCEVWNHGAGVAIITHARIFVNDKLIAGATAHDVIPAITRALRECGANLISRQTQMNWIDTPEGVSPGGHIQLAHIVVPPDQNPYAVLTLLRFEFEYESLYGETFELPAKRAGHAEAGGRA